MYLSSEQQYYHRAELSLDTRTSQSQYAQHVKTLKEKAQSCIKSVAEKKRPKSGEGGMETWARKNFSSRQQLEGIAYSSLGKSGLAFGERLPMRHQTHASVLAEFDQRD